MHGFVSDWILPVGISRLKKTFEVRRKKALSVESMTQGLKSIGFTNDLGRHRNSSGGGRCFVLATGPSIQTQDLTVLSGSPCIAVSMFHLHKDIEVLKPKWHVLAPPHVPFKMDTVRKIIETANERYASKPNFLFGHTSYECSYLRFLLDNREFANYFRDSCYFVNYDVAPILSEANAKNPDVWDPTVNPFQIRTVIYSAIQLAYFLGFKEIVLLGCDHDYLSDIERVENHHFYQEQEGFSDKENLAVFTRERWFQEYFNRWKDYRLMRDFLSGKGVMVYNATNGGMLDVFERKALSDFF